MNRRCFSAFFFIAYFAIGNALECYVCTDQAGNVDKCLNTIITCEQDEDVCMTQVRWGSERYWTSGGRKQFYISKTCAAKKECERTKRADMKYCTQLWYEDWKCSDCCVGDRCNFFIFSSGSNHTTSLGMLLFAIVAPLIGTSWAMK